MYERIQLNLINPRVVNITATKVVCTWSCWTLPLWRFERERRQLVHEIISLNKILRIPRFRKYALKLCTIQCFPHLSHARSRNFAWHRLWLATTEGKNIVKLFTTSQTRQFQLFSTNLPSNFWKIARLLGKIKNTVSKRSSSERTCPYWQWKSAMTGTYGPGEKHSRRVLRGQLFSKGKI